MEQLCVEEMAPVQMEYGMEYHPLVMVNGQCHRQLLNCGGAYFSRGPVSMTVLWRGPGGVSL